MKLCFHYEEKSVFTPPWPFSEMLDFYGQGEDIQGKLIFPGMHVTIEANGYDKTEAPLEIIPLYELIKTDEETVGAVVGISTRGYTVLLLNNKVKFVGFDERIFILSSDNTARDRNNDRVFKGDYIAITDGEYKGFSGQVICNYKRKLFGNFIHDKTPSTFFVDSQNCRLVQDDEGPV